MLSKKHAWSLALCVRCLSRASTGFGAVEALSWGGLFAPARTPPGDHAGKWDEVIRKAGVKLD